MCPYVFNKQMEDFEAFDWNAMVDLHLIGQFMWSKTFSTCDWFIVKVNEMLVLIFTAFWLVRWWSFKKWHGWLSQHLIVQCGGSQDSLHMHIFFKMGKRASFCLPIVNLFVSTSNPYLWNSKIKLYAQLCIWYCLMSLFLYFTIFILDILPLF